MTVLESQPVSALKTSGLPKVKITPAKRKRSGNHKSEQVVAKKSTARGVDTAMGEEDDESGDMTTMQVEVRLDKWPDRR